MFSGGGQINRPLYNRPWNGAANGERKTIYKRGGGFSAAALLDNIIVFGYYKTIVF